MSRLENHLLLHPRSSLGFRAPIGFLVSIVVLKSVIILAIRQFYVRTLL